MRLPTLAAALLGACTSHSHYVLIHGYGDMHGVRDGLEYHIERTLPDNVARVAVYRAGALHGAEGLPEPERARLGLRDGQLADHPSLAAWREQLARLSALAGDLSADAGAFADAAVGFPFTLPASEAAVRFTEGRPERAAALLDRADDLALDEDALVTILDRALGASDVHDARVAAWVRSRTLRDQEAALVRVARAEVVGPEAATVLLARIEEVQGPARAELYGAAGARLVSRPEHAALLGRTLEELYGSARPQAALALLSREDASPAYAEAVLAGIDDFYGDERVAVYRGAAPLAIRDGQAALVVHALVEEIYGADRTRTAVWLVGRADAPPAVVAGLARELDEFYGDDRVRVLGALLSSAGFRGDAQREVVRAVAREFQGDERAQAFARVAAAPALEPAARSLLDLSRDN